MSRSSAQQPASRFAGLDVLKCICAFMVVLVHCSYGSASISVIIPVLRMAVPVFFMISGFFFEQRWPHVHLRRQILKALRMLLAGAVIYLILLALTCRSTGTTLSACMALTADGMGAGFLLRNALLFNSCPLPNAEHLWYLAALIYTLCIVWTVRRILGRTGMFLLYLGTPFLLLGAAVLSNYSTLITGYRFYVFETRNFLLCGIPYFCLGSLIFTARDFLAAHINRKVLWAMFLLLCVSACAEEQFLLGVRTINALDFYFSTPFQAVCAFLLFLNLPHAQSPLYRPLSTIGRKHSGVIYLVHLASGSLVRSAAAAIGLHAAYEALAPLALFLSALAVSIAYRALLSRLAPRRT